MLRGLQRHRRAVLAATALSTVYLLTRILFAATFPYFFDEGTYAGFMRAGADSVHRLFVSLTIGREPLMIWLGIPLVKVGFNPLIAARMVSVVAGLLTVPVVGLIAKRLAGGPAGWCAAAVTIVLPFFLVHDGIGIYEPLVTLIVASALLVQIELARRPSLQLGIALAIVAAAGVLTKRNTLPALLLVPVSLLLFDWSGADRGERLRRWLLAVGIGALGALAAELLLRSSSYWPAYQTFNHANANGVSFSGVRPLGDVLRNPFRYTEQAWRAYRPALIGGYLTIPYGLAAIAGAVLMLRRARPTAWLLLVWIAVPFAVSMTVGTNSYPRHVMYLMPPTIVLIAYALIVGGSWLRKRLPRGWVPLSTTAALALSIPTLRFDAQVLAHPRSATYPGVDEFQYVTGPAAGGEWSAVADAIRRRAHGTVAPVLLENTYLDVLRFVLEPDSRYPLVRGVDPQAPAAQFGIVDQLRFIPDVPAIQLAQRLHFRAVARFRRPNHGAVIVLYERP